MPENKEKKNKKRKAKDEPAPVTVEFGSNDGYSASTGGGELVLPGSRKKAKKDKPQVLPEKKENLKKKKRREEISQALQRQISKKKEKALATVQKRKEKKQTVSNFLFLCYKFNSHLFSWKACSKIFNNINSTLLLMDWSQLPIDRTKSKKQGGFSCEYIHFT